MTKKELLKLKQSLNELFNELTMDIECTIIYDAMYIVDKVYKRVSEERGIKHMENWTPIDPNITSVTLGEFLRIVDDALSHGFEFKVENGIVYTRLQ